MSAVVVDASALIDSLVDDGGSTRRELGARELHAPHLIGAELLSWLRKFSLKRELQPMYGNELLQRYASLPLTHHSHELLLPRAWSMRHTITAYDAMYVVLAEALSVPLITRDRRLAAAASSYCEVIVP